MNISRTQIVDSLHILDVLREPKIAKYPVLIPLVFQLGKLSGMIVLIRRICLHLLKLSDLRFELFVLFLVFFKLKFDELEEIFEFSAVEQVFTNLWESVILEEDVQAEIWRNARFVGERTLGKGRCLDILDLTDELICVKFF